jgi:polysaccharide biosynthesis protein PslG
MRRRSPSRLASLAAAFALAAALAVPAPAAAAPQMAGLQSHVLWANVDLAEMDRQLDELKAANAAITRVDVGWSSIEHDHKGDVNHWYLDRLDHLVEAANARGIKLLLTLFATPCWASTAPSSLKQDCRGDWWHRDVQYYAPRHASDYADALAFLVGRYGDRVYSWEIWNEPNQPYFFHSDDPVRDYAAMVRAAYPAAKAADPRPLIVAGSLSDSDFEFTDALYRRGVKGSFDAFSVHPYSADRSPLETRVSSPRYSFRLGVPAVHRVMRAHGDGRPLWLTEWGWSTCNVRGAARWQNCVDESTQATYLRLAFRQIKSWSYVPVATWFKLENTTSAADDRTGNYGLLTQDGRRKPAFDAFRGVALELRRGGGDRPRTRRHAVAHVRRGGRYRSVGRRPSHPYGHANWVTATAVLSG